ncbi:copper amine oxidase N-terminal domain-containing protein [Alkaliphilus sp. MSJ-5]|uniref:Copper amine oxidase N-terminal domain-containing protein n=1 Tax=Alkaliphilus flagellatus TaxID=2841507 RepID=A0ABS6G4B2_9FIRM|nr:copper amine oxidase N-terminal domain-containing protein [Alkaliphilus flagellatus]MBU5676517.1 copper amine oxidase N-terminal domain-containing protein [Alkaliphilus flagellatus]
MLKKKRMIGLLVTTMTLVTAFGFSSYGASATKTLQALYGSSKIIINGKDVTQTIEPFIVDGTTYIPLRVVANTFNKKVDWNPLTSTAYITDDLTQVNEHFQAEILKRDVEIMNLQSRLKQLEKEVESKKEISLSDLEKQLNKDHGEYKNIEFDISLSGSASKVNVKIDVDLYDYKKEWNGLSSSKRESYLQDIVDDVLDAYDGANVYGSIKDIDAKKTILEFTTTSKGVVKIEKESTTSNTSNKTISKLEKDLDNEYYDYFGDIDLYIKLEGNKNDVTFSIELDSKEYGSAWRKLSSDKIKKLMSFIYDDIEDELGDVNIEGYVYDTYNKEDLASYRRASSGNDIFKKY